MGEISKQDVGSMISVRQESFGIFSINFLNRGLICGPNIDVYEGQVIGNTAKGRYDS